MASSRFGPMAGLAHGPETDFETNDMRTLLDDERQSRKQEQQAASYARYQALLTDLQGSGGETARLIAILLAKRIDALVEEDPEARAYANMLRTCCDHLRTGEAVAGRLSRELFDHVTRGSHG